MGQDFFGYNKKGCGCEGFTKNEQEIEHLEYLKDIEKNKQKYYDEIGIGQRFHKASFNNFTTDFSGQESALKKAKTFVDNFIKSDGRCRGLFFIGKPGTGKTHLCTAVCKEILPCAYYHAGCPLKIVNVTEFLNEIKATYNDNAQERESDVLEKYNYALLIFDDLGKEYSRISLGGSWASEKIYAVINKRYEKEMATIVTTNLSITELEKKIDPAIVSRLFEMCEGVKCNWKDYRKEGK